MLRTTIALGALLALPAGAQSVVDKIDGLTANQGLYGNRIPDRTFSRPVTEVCITGGGVVFDQNAAGESTQGGACRPLQKGWVIERDQREATTWTEARIACTIDDMRLPEVMEWQYSCLLDDAFGINDMVGDWEWTTNAPLILTDTSGRSVSAAVLGLSACTDGSRGPVARQDDSLAISFSFRCVR